MKRKWTVPIIAFLVLLAGGIAYWRLSSDPPEVPAHASLKDQILTKTTVSGEPADKVNLSLNTMGNTADETILELNDEHLLLLDKDGKTKYDRRRVKEGEKP